jgi:hypothetical protein
VREVKLLGLQLVRQKYKRRKKMYNVGDIFYNDEEYSKRAAFCNENNLKIVEIEEDEQGKGRFQIQEIPPLSKVELARLEVTKLQTWFDEEYSRHEQKLRRLSALDKPDDDGVNANIKLGTLYSEAEVRRARIQELEKIINK